MRTATVERKTNETTIRVTVNLDGVGRHAVSTGIGFLDHMLEQLSRHSLIDLSVEAKGDLHIDGHHTTEDSAIAIGQAFTRVVVDVSGRPYCVWKVRLDRPRLGDLDSELVPHWFQTFAFNAGLTLHIETLYGENNHHICESCFKGLARALREAVEVDARKADAIPSTKGTLGSTSTLST